MNSIKVIDEATDDLLSEQRGRGKEPPLNHNQGEGVDQGWVPWEDSGKDRISMEKGYSLLPHKAES